MNECFLKLKELIENIVLVDIEDQMDEVFLQITQDKNGKEKYEAELEELREMRVEFQEILEDIKHNELTQEECKELYDEIFLMISGEDEEL